MRPDFRKIWVIATTEFNTSVRTKAFMVSLLLLPILVGSSILLQQFIMGRVDTRTRTVAVVDRTGKLFPAIERAARAYNDRTVDAKGKAVGPRIEPSSMPASAAEAPSALLELSDRIRRGELDAFAVIPAEAARIPITGTATPPAIEYHSDNPNDDAVTRWLIPAINNEVHARRFRSTGIDQAVADRANQPVIVENLGLFERDLSAPSGEIAIKPAEKIDRIRTSVVPVVSMYVVFLVIMACTPPLLNSVIEEKMSKISEVLLGSVTPFELMMGKLLGLAAVGVLLGILYIAGGYAVAAYHGYADAISARLLVAMGFFLVMAVFLFGSQFMAVGAACSELKDAQSLMMPVLLVSMFPMMVWPAILKDPASPLSVGLSLFPPASPYLMLMRIGMRPAPPAWQVVLSGVGITLTTILCIWAAGKVFRTGLLMQGKAPTFRELARWVMAK